MILISFLLILMIWKVSFCSSPFFFFFFFFVITHPLLSDFKKIGEGNFGRIWRGDYLGTTVAVKQLLDVDDEDMHKYIEREMLTLRQMRHPNIIQVIDKKIQLEQTTDCYR